MLLNDAYPLRGYQKFYEPDFQNYILKPKLGSPKRRDVRVKTPPPAPSEVLHDGSAWDPNALPPLPSLPSAGPSHWTMHPNLDGKTFLAAYNNPSGEKQDRVHAKPDRASGRVFVTYHHRSVFPVPPEHIFDVSGKYAIKASAYQGGLLAVRGPHVGKYMRRIYMLYDDKQHWKDPWMSCMVFGNWGSSDEYVVEEYVLADAGDCAPCEERKPTGDLALRIKMVRELARKKVQRPRPDPSLKQQNKRQKK
jgi:hypothetical protein